MGHGSAAPMIYGHSHHAHASVNPFPPHLHPTYPMTSLIPGSLPSSGYYLPSSIPGQPQVLHSSGAMPSVPMHMATITNGYAPFPGLPIPAHGSSGQHAMGTTATSTSSSSSSSISSSRHIDVVSKSNSTGSSGSSSVTSPPIISGNDVPSNHRAQNALVNHPTPSVPVTLISSTSTVTVAPGNSGGPILVPAIQPTFIPGVPTMPSVPLNGLVNPTGTSASAMISPSYIGRFPADPRPVSLVPITGVRPVVSSIVHGNGSFRDRNAAIMNPVGPVAAPVLPGQPIILPLVHSTPSLPAPIPRPMATGITSDSEAEKTKTSSSPIKTQAPGSSEKAVQPGFQNISLSKLDPTPARPPSASANQALNQTSRTRTFEQQILDLPPKAETKPADTDGLENPLLTMATVASEARPLSAEKNVSNKESWNDNRGALVLARDDDRRSQGSLRGTPLRKNKQQPATESHGGNENVGMIDCEEPMLVESESPSRAPYSRPALTGVSLHLRGTPSDLQCATAPPDQLMIEMSELIAANDAVLRNAQRAIKILMAERDEARAELDEARSSFFKVRKHFTRRLESASSMAELLKSILPVLPSEWAYRARLEIERHEANREFGMPSSDDSGSGGGGVSSHRTMPTSSSDDAGTADSGNSNPVAVSDMNRQFNDSPSSGDGRERSGDLQRISASQNTGSSKNGSDIRRELELRPMKSAQSPTSDSFMHERISSVAHRGGNVDPRDLNSPVSELAMHRTSPHPKRNTHDQQVIAHSAGHVGNRSPPPSSSVGGPSLSDLPPLIAGPSSGHLDVGSGRFKRKLVSKSWQDEKESKRTRLASSSDEKSVSSGVIDYGPRTHTGISMAAQPKLKRRRSSQDLQANEKMEISRGDDTDSRTMQMRSWSPSQSIRAPGTVSSTNFNSEGSMSVVLTHMSSSNSSGQDMGSAVSSSSGRGSSRVVQSEPPRISSRKTPKSLQLVASMPHAEVVCASVFGKEARTMYTGDKGTVKMWERGFSDSEPPRMMASVECFKQGRYVRAVKLCPAGNLIAVAGESNLVQIYDVARDIPKLVHSLDTGSIASYCLAWLDQNLIGSDNNQGHSMLVTGIQDGRVLAWDLRTPRTFRELGAHTPGTGTACIEAGLGAYKAYSGGLDNTVRIWDARQGGELHRVNVRAPVYAMAHYPDQSRELLACGLGDRRILGLDLSPSTMNDMVAASAGCNATVITGHDSTNSNVPRASSTMQCSTFDFGVRKQRHKHSILSLRFASTGSWMLSTSKDKVIKVWSVRDQEFVNGTGVIPGNSSSNSSSGEPPAVPVEMQSTSHELNLNQMKTYPSFYPAFNFLESAEVVTSDISACGEWVLTGSSARFASLYKVYY